MDNKKKENSMSLPHDIELKSRKNLHITGVIEVVSVTSTNITLKTNGGPLVIVGIDLKIKNLSQDQKEVSIDGEIDEIKYSKKKKKLFEKVFK